MRYSDQIITIGRGDNQVKVKQVTKTTAKKSYDNGETVYMMSCNMRPNNIWQSPWPVKKDNDAWSRTFEQQVNEFEYYNCDSERGKYAIFFIQIK